MAMPLATPIRYMVSILFIVAGGKCEKTGFCVRVAAAGFGLSRLFGTILDGKRAGETSKKPNFLDGYGLHVVFYLSPTLFE